MKNYSHNRMAPNPRNREQAPPEPPVVVDVPVPVVQCPRCGAARVGQWATLSGGKAGRGVVYRCCRACGTKYAFSADGLRCIG